MEESSPDLLKNTPMNIARLEDVIEQCEGRVKYLARTRSPSDGEDIRWYFCKVPLAEKELSASVPRTAIVGKSEYFRFSMRDSLALEASFLQREEELLSHWWREYAECSEGPSGSRMTSNITSETQSTLDPLREDQQSPLRAIEEERVGVPVKGGLYEVDLIRRHCFPVYWHGENRRVLRGQWFVRKSGLDWLPIREDVAEQLELAYRCQIWHRRTFQPSGLFAARVDLQGTNQGLHALFTGEDDTWEAWLCVDSSGFSLNIGGNGVKLRRGFSSSGSLKPTQDELRQQKEEEMDDYCSQVPVGHLVFMVHGIGQRLEKANLVDDVGNFRHITESLAERHLSPYQRGTQRVLYIPCQWRRGLKLSGESAVEKITLDGVRGLRVTLSATVHDVLYYMSPIYCQDIIDSVSNQLNKLYMKFIKRNPGYNGKVSIYGHSLGSVLSYDILCHQEKLSSPFPMDFLYTGDIRGEETDQHVASSSPLDQVEGNVEPSDGTAEELGSVTEGDNSISKSDIAVHEENTKYFNDSVDPSSVLDLGLCSSGNDSASDFKKELNDGCPGQSGELFIVGDGKNPDQQFCLENDGNMVICDGSAKDGEISPAANSIESTSDKDQLNFLLQNEVNSLKSRIAELESKLSISNSEDKRPRISSDDRREDQSTGTSICRNLAQDHDEPRKSYTPYIKYTKLDFKVDTFFAVGSPLGVFLSLRNIRIGIGRGQEYWQDEKISEEMPSCRQMFNIFHPFDPVAYRIEPLICKEYIGKRPIIIPYHRGGKRLHIGFQEFKEDMSSRSQAIVNHLSNMRVKVVSVFQSSKTDDTEVIEDGKHTEERSYGSFMMQRLTGSEDGRVDYMLQDKTFQHPYISALGSHTNYWRDPDTALFILKHLYRDIPEEPNPNEEPSCSEDSSRNQRRTEDLFYRTEVMDEDIPLTFSDHSLVREFSRKVRKHMNRS
ncbi:hypothetical protein QJS04_geneDACA018576 [Acorus gramineus]|uniref:DDHD domain-containing protein n=1 Tax=Acorus gramineus TaxID=55184 RepID=A0AAV9AFP1_ACOGR|nr:hypothetical protein QJS04_geneDACA018576 [Acorus gramineus]